MDEKASGFYTALNDGRDGVRELAIRRLIALGEPVVPDLIAKMNTKDAFIQECLEYILVHIGPPAVPHLQAALQSDDRKIRWNAAAVLGAIGTGGTPNSAPSRRQKAS